MFRPSDWTEVLGLVCVQRAFVRAQVVVLEDGFPSPFPVEDDWVTKLDLALSLPKKEEKKPAAIW